MADITENAQHLWPLLKPFMVVNYCRRIISCGHCIFILREHYKQSCSYCFHKISSWLRYNWILRS